MTRAISSTEAARSFSDLLNRARYREESFIIIRGGEEVGRLVPPRKSKSSTLGDLLEVVRRFEADGDFAEDLEQIQREQPHLRSSPWDS